MTIILQQPGDAHAGHDFSGARRTQDSVDVGAAVAGPGADAGAEGAGQASGSKKDSGVIDAEFEESAP